VLRLWRRVGGWYSLLAWLSVGGAVEVDEDEFSDAIVGLGKFVCEASRTMKARRFS